MRCASPRSSRFRPSRPSPFHAGAVASIAALVAVAGGAYAALVDSFVVGSGASASFVQFQFTNANTYLYEVRYDGAMTGKGLFAIIGSAQPGFFSYTFDTYSFGDFVTGITVGADSDSGYGTPPDYLDYWHYWTRAAAADGWTESFIGFGDRAVSNGSWDGWVFNSAGAPSAVPAPGAIALVAFAAVARRRRR